MDTTLLGQAVSQHGADLVLCLQSEQQGRLPVGLIQQLSRYPLSSSQPDIKDERFVRSVNQFIAKKADILFAGVNSEGKVIQKEQEVEDNYAIMPALESFMGIPSQVCKEHFFNSLEKHEVVIGVVTSVVESGLLVSLLCLDSGRARDIDDLKIMVFCPAKEVPKIVPDQSALESFHVKDIVRGMVLNVNPETQRIIISLQDKSVSSTEPSKPKLGLITEDDFPVHYRRKLHVRGLTFDELLQSIIGFNNSGNVEYLLQLHHLKDDSLMRGLHNLKIPEKEYAENLRKWQCQKLALQSVAQGVALFKKGKQMEAMQHLNKALQIDETNVEALVARGALYANNESFSQAVEDFEAALKLNPTHTNATKYLLETRLAQGKLCEDQKDYLGARDCYQQAVTVDPTSREAIATLQELEQKLVRSGSSRNRDLGKRSRQSRDDSPRRSRDDSPRQMRDDSPRRSRDDSPRRRRDDSPRRRRDSSPRRDRDRSQDRRYRNKSPRRFRDESPRRVRDRSPQRFRDESPRRVRDGSQRRFRDESPRQVRDGSQRRFRDVSPRQVRDGSPRRFRDESPRQVRDGSPRRFRDESPQRVRDGSPRRFREKSPRRFRNKSPERFSDESKRRFMDDSPGQFREDSPKRYRDQSSQEYNLEKSKDKLKRLMEEEKQEPRKAERKRRSEAEPESFEPQQKQRRESDSRKKEFESRQTVEEEMDNPYASIFGRKNISIPCLGSPERIGGENSFPEGYCNPQDPNFVPRSGQSREQLTTSRDKIIISPHDAQFREALKLRRMSHGDSSPSDFDRSHSPKSAKSKSPFDEEAFLYGESEYDTLQSKSKGILKSRQSNEWEEGEGEQGSRSFYMDERKAKRDPSMSPDWEHVRSHKVVRVETPSQRKDDRRKQKSARDSSSSSDSSSGSSSSSSSSSSSGSSSSSPEERAMGDYYEKRGVRVPKGIRTDGSFLDKDYELSYDDSRKSSKTLKKDSKAGEKMKLDKRRDVKLDKSSKDQEKQWKQGQEKLSVDKRRQASIDRESNVSGLSRGSRQDMSVRNDESGSSSRKDCLESDSRKKKPSDKSTEDKKLEKGDQEPKKKFKEIKSSTKSPEKVIQDASISSLSEKLESGTGESRKEHQGSVSDEKEQESSDNPLLSRSLFHVASRWDSPPIDIQIKPESRKYENIQISISTTNLLENDPSGIRIFSGKQLSKYRPNKHVDQSDSEDDELERLFQKENKGVKKSSKAKTPQSGQGKAKTTQKDLAEKVLAARQLIEKAHSKDEKVSSKDRESKLRDEGRYKSDSHYKDDRDRYYDDDRRSDSDRRRSSDYRRDDDSKYSRDYRRDDDRRRSSDYRHDDKYDDRRHDDSHRHSERRDSKEIHYDDFGDDYDYTRRDVRPRSGEYRRCDKYCQRNHFEDDKLGRHHSLSKEDKYSDSRERSDRSRDRSRRRSSSFSSSSSSSSYRSRSPRRRSSSSGRSSRSSSTSSPKKVKPDQLSPPKPSIPSEAVTKASDDAVPNQSKKLASHESEQQPKGPNTSLDELESFLSDLKDKKKQQWIAEGKVKTST